MEPPLCVLVAPFKARQQRGPRNASPAKACCCILLLQQDTFHSLKPARGPRTLRGRRQSAARSLYLGTLHLTHLSVAAPRALVRSLVAFCSTCQIFTPATLHCSRCRPSDDRTRDRSRSCTSMNPPAPSARRMKLVLVCCNSPAPLAQCASPPAPSALPGRRSARRKRSHSGRRARPPGRRSRAQSSARPPAAVATLESTPRSIVQRIVRGGFL